MADSEIDNLTVKKNAAVLGNIGIGKPASEAALDVSKQGDGAVVFRLSSERHWEFRQLGTGEGTALELKSVGGGGNKEFLINTTGRVRVGTRTGGASFEVNGNIEIVGEPPTDPSKYRGQLRISDPSGKCMIFAMANDCAFVQSHNGKPLVLNPVGNYTGIGIASPQYSLHVAGTFCVAGAAPADANQGQLRVAEATSGKCVLLGRTQKYGFLQSHNREPLALNPLGNNVGIGTSAPEHRLHVAGTFCVEGAANFQADIRLNSRNVLLRFDGYHGIAWREKFGGQMVDGPVMFGWGGGALGCFDQAGERIALKWSKEGNMSVAGKVAIGKANPAAALDVQGSIMVSEDVLLQGADCAEEFELDKACMSATDPGTVMVLDDEGHLRPSASAYDKRVAGVVSGAGDLKPGIVLDRQPSRENRCAIALVGKVFCKVDASNDPVAVGDLLTTSATPGHAMKVLDPAQAFGAVLGKALRPLPRGQGLIPILVALQ